MAVRAGVRGGAVAPQGGVALTAVGRREGDGTPKLAVRAGRGAEGSGPWDEPAAHCNKEDRRQNETSTRTT